MIKSVCDKTIFVILNFGEGGCGETRGGRSQNIFFRVLNFGSRKKFFCVLNFGSRKNRFSCTKLWITKEQIFVY